MAGRRRAARWSRLTCPTREAAEGARAVGQLDLAGDGQAGGVDPTTAPLVAEAGADVLVAGSAVFKGGSVSNSAPYGDNIRAIRAAAEAALR